MRHRLRTWFIAGLIVFLPVAITFSIIAWLFRIVDSFLGWLLPPLVGRPIPGVGLIASIVVIFVIGALATNVLGRRFVGFFEGMLLRIPLARSIYAATKSISATLFLQRRDLHGRFCHGGYRRAADRPRRQRVRGEHAQPDDGVPHAGP